MEAGKHKVVYTIVEKGPNRSYWTRVGVGFPNKDGSLTLRLDAVPVNGVLQVRDYEARDDRRPMESAPRELSEPMPRALS